MTEVTQDRKTKNTRKQHKLLPSRGDIRQCI